MSTSTIARNAGKKILASKISKEYFTEISDITCQLQSRPKLVGYLANDDPAAKMYATWTGKTCEELGFKYELLEVPKENLEEEIYKANDDDLVNGIIVYFPVYNDRQDQYLQQCVSLKKDVEGLNFTYVSNMYHNIRFLDDAKLKKSIIPCTPLAIVKILEYLKVYNPLLDYGDRLYGKTITVVNRSEIVGRPLLALLANDGATVYSVDIANVQKFERGDNLRLRHHRVIDTTYQLKDVAPISDVIITGVPSKNYKFDTSLIKNGAVCINFSSEKNFNELDVLTKAGLYVPMTGKVTIAMLLRNMLRLMDNDGKLIYRKIDWDSISGLPGFILTSADQGRTALNLNYGGVDKFFQYIVSTWRYFIFRFGLKLSINEFDNGDSMDLGQKSGFKVKVVSIGNSQELPLVPSISVYESLSNLVDNVFPTKEMPQRRDALTMVALPDIEIKSTHSCNYIIEFNSIRGRFLVEKLKLLKVPLGPMCSQLSRGENVTLEDGTVVLSEQVMEPQRDYGKVVVLDIPDESYLNETLLNNWGENAKISLFYHFLGENLPISVLQSQLYDEFFQKYSNARHFISHQQISSNAINFHSSAQLTLKLKSINNELFRLPQMNINQGVTNLCHDNVFALNSLQKLSIKPQDDVEYTDKESNTLDSQYWDKTFYEHIDPVKFQFYDKKEILSPPVPKSVDDIEVITLGTGSALPSKYRNVTCTVIRIPQGQSTNAIILDAGENTIGSMKRLFSKSELHNFFTNELSMIYLSHLHADHHLGIISLIKAFNHYNQGTERKLYVICPWQYDLFLKEWFKFNNDTSELNDIIYLNNEFFEVNKKFSPIEQYNFQNFPNINTLPKKYDDLNIPQDLLLQLQQIGIVKMDTCKAIHCDWAYSVLITFQTLTDNFKISYSGDTRPSQEFVKIGQDSDLLIHESTLEDELIEDLIDKKHTTILELKHVLLLMKLRKLVLTHFSQRYPRLPVLNDELEDTVKQDEIKEKTLRLDSRSLFKFKTERKLGNDKILYAFDNMWFKYSDIHLQYQRFSNLDMDLDQLFEFNDDEEEPVKKVKKKRTSDEL